MVLVKTPVDLNTEDSKLSWTGLIKGLRFSQPYQTLFGDIVRPWHDTDVHVVLFLMVNEQVNCSSLI